MVCILGLCSCSFIHPLVINSNKRGGNNCSLCFAVYSPIPCRKHSAPCEKLSAEIVELTKYLSPMGQWPPTWGGFYNRGDALPRGEEPEKLVSVTEDDFDKTLVLTVQYKGNNFLGIMTIEDTAARSMLKRMFGENIGMSIKAIGSLDVWNQ